MRFFFYLLYSVTQELMHRLISLVYFLVKQVQGSHRLEKYLDIQDCLDKSLKIKFALKILEKHSMALKSPEFYYLQEDSTMFLET